VRVSSISSGSGSAFDAAAHRVEVPDAGLPSLKISFEATLAPIIWS
jgi:hypothetical protein